MKKIDIITNPLSQYGVLQHFTKQLHKAFLSLGIESRLLSPKKTEPREFIENILDNETDYTLSFNGILPDVEGRFFSDFTGIPHISFLVDSPNQFLQLTKSDNTRIITVDEEYVDFYQGMGFEKAYFVPHGIEKEAQSEVNCEKKRDVLFLGSFIDVEGIRKKWLASYPVSIVRVFEKTAEFFIENEDDSMMESFSKALGEVPFIDPSVLDLPLILQEIEDFIVGTGRISLLESLDGLKIDLFGSGWNDSPYLKKWDHYISFHEACGYEQALEHVKNSKIILNSAPTMKRGIHERILMGGIKGSLVVSEATSFLKETFGDSILYFTEKNKSTLKGKIETALSSFSENASIRKEMQEKILKNHTWEKRAEEILKLFS